MIAAVLLALLVLQAAVPRKRLAEGLESTAESYEAIAAELRRGANLRHAIAAVHPNSRLSRLALSGQPMDAIAAELAARSPEADPLIEAGVQLAAASGAPAASLFVALAERVRLRREAAAKKRVLTAQARASAAVIATLPLLVGTLLVASRSAGVLATSAAARYAVATGVVLELGGAGIVIAMVRRAGR